MDENLQAPLVVQSKVMALFELSLPNNELYQFIFWVTSVVWASDVGQLWVRVLLLLLFDAQERNTQPTVFSLRARGPDRVDWGGEGEVGDWGRRGKWGSISQRMKNDP